MNGTEKQVEALLKVLPLRTREILNILSLKSCRTPIAEIVFTIEARAAGRMPDMGEAVVTRLIPLDQIPEIHRAEEVSLQPLSSEVESPGL